jgi:putative transposase
VQEAKAVFTRLFKDFERPQRIRTDNGVPFAPNTLARLSPLSAWWVRLSSCRSASSPVPHSQTAAARRAQQRQVERFRQAFNCERPHEALDMQSPASRYAASPRELPNKLPPLVDPDRFEVRDVRANGGIRWNRQWVNVVITWASEYVGLEELDEGVWNVSFGPLKLDRLPE